MGGNARKLIDGWARRLGANISRRAALAAVVGGAVGGGGVGPANSARAAGDEVCKAADPRDFVSRQSCKRLACGSDPGCVCAQTVGHKPVCVRGFDPDSPRCPSRDQCSSKRPCGGGQVCAKTQVCCGREVRACLRRCAT
jgi:hypothetical protein